MVCFLLVFLSNTHPVVEELEREMSIAVFFQTGFGGIGKDLIRIRTS